VFCQETQGPGEIMRVREPPTGDSTESFEAALLDLAARFPEVVAVPLDTPGAPFMKLLDRRKRGE
jgi:hypothetical protein